MTWLILEDNPSRVEAFHESFNQYGQAKKIHIWRITAHMIAELDSLLPNASLISLDYDLYKQSENDPDPGCGRDVANYLSEQKPVCPIVIHSTTLMLHGVCIMNYLPVGGR